MGSSAHLYYSLYGNNSDDNVYKSGGLWKSAVEGAGDTQTIRSLWLEDCWLDELAPL